MRFLTLERVIGVNGEFHLYELFDNMGYTNLKQYVCCDGRPVVRRLQTTGATDLPVLCKEEEVLLKMTSDHFYRNYPKTWMTCTATPMNDSSDVVVDICEHDDTILK